MTRIAGVIAAVLFATSAEAQGRLCAPRDKVIEQIAGKHGEAQQSYGLQQSGAVIEIWANTDTGSWTVFVSTPEGMSCLVAVGEAFGVVKVKKGVEG
jgi:hypothetical protein